MQAEIDDEDFGTNNKTRSRTGEKVTPKDPFKKEVNNENVVAENIKNKNNL